MRKLFVFFLIVLICLYPSMSFSALDKVQVTATKLNVRAKPKLNSEVVTQLELDEIVEVMEEGEGWTRIKAPIHTSCWVHTNYVEKGRITNDAVNLRSGPGEAFPSLCLLYKGTPVNFIEVFGDWVHIKPPIEFGVWVSSDYLGPIKKGKTNIVEKTVVEEKLAKKEEEKKIKVSINDSKKTFPSKVSVPQKEISGVSLVSYAGYLEDLGVIVNRPGTYKLVLNEKWLCILKSPTLELNSYSGRMIRVEGVVLTKKTSWGVPVIEVKRLHVIE